jgi:hypothetical protein
MVRGQFVPRQKQRMPAEDPRSGVPWWQSDYITCCNVMAPCLSVVHYTATSAQEARTQVCLQNILEIDCQILEFGKHPWNWSWNFGIHLKFWNLENIIEIDSEFLMWRNQDPMILDLPQVMDSCQLHMIDDTICFLVVPCTVTVPV